MAVTAAGAVGITAFSLISGGLGIAFLGLPIILGFAALFLLAMLVISKSPEILEKARTFTKGYKDVEMGKVQTQSIEAETKKELAQAKLQEQENKATELEHQKAQLDVNKARQEAFNDCLNGVLREIDEQEREQEEEQDVKTFVNTFKQRINTRINTRINPLLRGRED